MFKKLMEIFGLGESAIERTQKFDSLIAPGISHIVDNCEVRKANGAFIATCAGLSSDAKQTEYEARNELRERIIIDATDRFMT